MEHKVETKLGTLHFFIHSENQGSLSFPTQVIVNRIPYKVEGQWSVYEPYGRNAEGRWEKTGKLAIRLSGYMPARRLDKPMLGDEPTPKAVEEIERVVTEAILPVLEKATRTGEAKRARLESELRCLRFDWKSANQSLARIKEDIRQKEQEMERVKAEIAELDLQIFHMSA